MPLFAYSIATVSQSDSLIPSCIHSLGTLNSFSTHKLATVSPALFFIFGSCFHSYYGINLFYMSNIATVFPSLS